MRKRISCIFTFVLVICSLIFVAPLGGTYAYEPTDIVDSKYLITTDIGDNQVYLSNEVAGKTSGYGRFVIDAQNVTLSTTAEQGYSVAGWNITYVDEDRSEFVNANDAVLGENNVYTQTVDIDSNYNVNITINYFDEYSNGVFNYSTFTISRVFGDLQVEPVFKYNYYKVQVDDALTIGNITELDNINLSASEILYYENSSVADGVTYYTNSYIYSDEGLFYFGDLYSENQTITSGDTSETLTRYYTLHYSSSLVGSSEKVDYSLGAYRIGENVNYNLNIALSSAIEDSVNIEITATNLITSEGTTALPNTGESNYYSVESDSFLRSSSYYVNFVVTHSSNLINTVDIVYDNLYLVTLVARIDGEVVTDVQETDVLNVVSVLYQYSQINNKQYFAKSQENNDGFAFRVSTIDVISKMIDGKVYNYYEFDSLDGDNQLYKTYPTINNNFEITIDYVSIDYTVDFAFAVNHNGTLNVLEGNYNLESPITANRGDELQINKTDISNNIGYDFYGFTLTTTTFQENDSITIEIDEERPENVTVIMVYELIDYTINIRNFDQITLINGEQTIYPITRIDYTHTRQSSSNTYSIYEQDLRLAENNSISLSVTANLNDSISLSTYVNNGFSILGYRLSELDNLSSGSTFSLNISQDIISQFADGTNINIYIYEDFVRYTSTFYIDPSLDTNTNQMVVMADIDVTAPEYAVVNKSFVVETGDVDYSVRHTIVVSNLKLYDQVSMNSVGREISNDQGESYRYIFVRFTENGLVNLDYTLNEDTNTYTHTSQIIRDNSISVVYSMESSKLYVSTNRADAYDLSLVTFMRNGEVVEKNEDGTIDAEEGELTVVLNPMSEDRTFAFGYSFVGYTFIKGGVSETVQSSNTTFVLQTIGSSVQYLELNFIELEYRLQVSQYGGDYDGELVEFEENQTYTSLDITDLTLKFEKPTGYYVSATYFVSNVENLYPEIVESNSNVTYTFSYTFNPTQWEDIVETYGVEVEGENYIRVDMRVLYSIYTFDVVVNYELTNPKNNSYDLLVPYPSINLVYVLNGVSETANFTRNENTLTFTGVPYGAQVSLNVGNIPSGFSALTNWTDERDFQLTSPYVASASQLSFSNITSNQVFKYKLDYLSYEIRLNYQNQGSPTVEVNNVLSNSITLYDSLRITMNANKASGFRFENMYYYRQEYVQYTYDENTWNSQALNLYIFLNNTYVRNDSYVYDENQTYYSLEDVIVNFAENTTFTDSLFNISNYKNENGVINFYIEYAYIEVLINNVNSNYADSPSLNRGDLTIMPEDYTTYSVSVYSNGIETEIEPGETVDYRDRVIIRVAFNSVEIDGQSFDLGRGIELELVNFLTFDSYTFKRIDDEEYTYLLVINISDIIANIPDSGELTINYYYRVKTVNTTITTNITSSSFYYTDNGRVFYLQANGIEGGFGGIILGIGDRDLSLTYPFQFLGTVSFDYWFIDSNYSNYFKITGIRLYDSTGREIENFADYGIYPQYDGEILESVRTRYVEDVTIHLIVQPIILFNGATVVNGDYVFTSMFICNNEGIGSPQELTIGSTQAYQIQTSELILSTLRDELGIYNIYYTNSNSVRVQPTNVGRYELHFVFNSSGDFEWINELNLNYRVYLDIIPRDVQITYDISRTFSKTYDGNSTVDPGLVTQYLVITDNAGMNLNYSTQYNFALASTITGRITYTDRGQEVETSRANEDVYYNIYLSGLAFTNTAFSNNFNLTNSTLTIIGVMRINRKPIDIVGIVADDKVYDGTNAVTLSGTENINLRGIVADDDVSLLLDNMVITFENADIGANKDIGVVSDNTLTGEDASNYVLNPVTGITASIYPYQVSTTIEGFGEITVINERGLTDKSKVSLIPIGATLSVYSFVNDSQDYLNIYNLIASYLSNGRVFEIGIELHFVQNGVELNLSNDLYISLPKVDRLTGVVYLTGENTGELTYTEQENTILVDLSQFEADVNTLFITRQRVLLELWQIILIVIFSLLLLIAIIIIIVISRKRKKERYSINDRI